MLSCFRRWSRTFSRRAAAAPKPRSRPRLLALEDRVVPTNIGGAAYFAVASGPQNTPTAPPTSVNVYDAATGNLVNTIVPFGSRFKLGANVAVGDVNGDGFDDVITGAGAGGTPHVRVFSGGGIGGVSPTDPTSQADVILNFFAGFSTSFSGGVRVGAGDLGGDRTTAEIVATAGPGGASHTIVYSTPRPGDPPVGSLQPTRLSQFFAFPTSYRGGSFATVGALTNNRDSTGLLYGDIIISKGSRGPAEVRVFRLLDAFDATTAQDGTPIGPNFVFTADLSDKSIVPNVDFTANFGSNFQGGGSVSVFHAGAVTATSNEFDAVNLLVGAGPGATSTVLTFAGTQMTDGQTAASLPKLTTPGNFTAFEQDFGGGAFTG